LNTIVLTIIEWNHINLCVFISNFFISTIIIFNHYRVQIIFKPVTHPLRKQLGLKIDLNIGFIIFLFLGYVHFQPFWRFIIFKYLSYLNVLVNDLKSSLTCTHK
jgi:hypothetical protein